MAGIFENLIQVLKAIPMGRKISFAITICLVIGGFIALMIWTNRPDYQVLFSNLDSNDAAKITEQLNEKRTPYILKEGGTAILVPSEMVYQLRLDLASEGIPRGGGVGFEVFDELSFGTTEFVQKLKFQQALQGELARTIMEFDAIEQARVHIVTAGDSLFAEPEKPATASVVIRPRNGMSLDQRQLQGIINLVACAVEGLRPDNVTVVDMAGGILSKGNDEDNIGDLSRTQFEYQRKLETSLEKRIQTMLEPVVGMNKVVARVSAEVDFRQVNISEETYDPDSAVVRSEQRQKESSTSGENISAGSPDLKYQVYQTENETAFTSPKRYNKENSIINYEVNKVNTHIINSAGDIKRLSAAVIIDGPYVMDQDAEGNMIPKFSPRNRKEMKMFDEIIKSAIGFNEQRGDQVSVSNIAFDMQDDPLSLDKAGANWTDYVKKVSKPLFNGLLVLLFILLAVRPFKKWLARTGEYVSTISLERGGDVRSIDSPSAEKSERQSAKQQLIDVTRENPDVAADIIRSWINEVS